MFIDNQLLKSFPINDFRERVPYPWSEISRFLTPSGFEALRQNFPPVELFKWHSDLTRPYGQRPHNRYYLAYEESTYLSNKRRGSGIARHKDLSQEWALFIRELETSEPYLTLVQSLFEVSAFKVRYAWHIGVTNSEVSAHVDSTKKIGTHIVYFNSDQDWNPEWGGSTLVLSGKSRDTLSPDFEDFDQSIQIQNVGNRSFLFKNGADAWHGMKPLRSPEGVYRRIFNIIFERPKEHNKPTIVSRGKSALKRVFNRQHM